MLKQSKGKKSNPFTKCVKGIGEILLYFKEKIVSLKLNESHYWTNWLVDIDQHISEKKSKALQNNGKKPR